MNRFRTGAAALLMILCLGGSGPAAATPPTEVLQTWYRLVLELVRHTPTYSPPVASRAFAYVGVTVHEVTESGADEVHSLAGQLNGLTPPPARAAAEYDEAVILQAALAHSARHFFANTGPTGQRAMAALEDRLGASAATGLASDVVSRSEAYGRAVAQHMIDWSATDGGAVVTNMGFPLEYELTPGPEHWVPTSLVVQQQVPLLPDWGKVRPFAMPIGNACPLPPPPAYSEDPASQFYQEAMEVVAAKRDLTPEQRLIARFWSDDPMLSPTPPGHWLSIALQVLAAEGADMEKHADVLARVGIAVADSFIGCWHSKFEYDLLRPITYIRRVIDPNWEPILITPPFPEYPSGHSTQSGAAAAVLTAIYGDSHAFSDATHVDDGLEARPYASFWAAAEEAGLSRLYGGIHFRAAIDRGLDQGRCIGAFAVALRTRGGA